MRVSAFSALPVGARIHSKQMNQNIPQRFASEAQNATRQHKSLIKSSILILLLMVSPFLRLNAAGADKSCPMTNAPICPHHGSSSQNSNSGKQNKTQYTITPRKAFRRRNSAS